MITSQMSASHAIEMIKLLDKKLNKTKTQLTKFTNRRSYLFLMQLGKKTSTFSQLTLARYAYLLHFRHCYIRSRYIQTQWL